MHLLDIVRGCVDSHSLHNGHAASDSVSTYHEQSTTSEHPTQILSLHLPENSSSASLGSGSSLNHGERDSARQTSAQANPTTNDEHTIEQNVRTASDEDSHADFTTSRASLIARRPWAKGAATPDHSVNCPESPRSEHFSRVNTIEQMSSSPRDEGWNPPMLRRRSFYAFATTYGVCIAILAVASSIDYANQGLGTVTRDLHYVWTYGPTLGERKAAF
jgi:hypothetical protein